MVTYQMPSIYGASIQTPKKVVVHAMGEYINDGKRIYHAKDWLDHLGLSAHFLITPSGVVIQTRSIYEGAFHAFEHNKDTIAIEYLLAGVWVDHSFRERIKTPYLYGEQYAAGVQTSRDLIQSNKKEHSHELKFVKHSAIDHRLRESGEKEKVDPGDGFPWDTYLIDIGYEH